MDLLDRIMELSRCGYFCSQILAILMLETVGEDNPGLVRAMGGLNGGVGFSRGTCGALAGGCCVLSYFAGKGAAEELPHESCSLMLAQLVSWFDENYGQTYGSCDCGDILEGNSANMLQRCPPIVEATHNKVMELLAVNGLL